MPYANIEDRKANGRKRYAADPEYRRKADERRKAWYHANKERAVANRKEWRVKHPDKVRAMYKKWAVENPLLHRAHKNAMEAKRDAAKLHATPEWLTKDHWEEIRSIYLKARELTVKTNEPHHVDHIVPLLGKTVRGLHVPWNLQVMKGIENMRKNNRMVAS